MKPPVVIFIAVALLVVAAVIWTTVSGNRRYRVELCMNFEGRSTCRVASAATRETAQRAALDNACAELASGVTGTTRCHDTQPSRLTWLAGE